MDDQGKPLSGGDGTAGFEVAWVRDGVEVRRPLADVAGVAFEEVAPVREFPLYRGQRHFPGLYWAATMLRHVGFESRLERDHAISMDFDPRVAWFASQPYWLFWTSAEGTRLTHAPDYFARRADGSAVVVDCRHEGRRRPRDLAKFAGTQMACEAVGWDIRLVGEIDRVRVANLRWLSGFRHPAIRSGRVGGGGGGCLRRSRISGGAGRAGRGR
ncbi:TnsA-like heteromeric transposase endonuclease subunit [Streptomyces sp. A1499]|uniref:TnsA-like heteromeric transposase endonuclease subunit n=1 Tax=Streptomyces sp. A1499 TaxID=2563104 RepID=UPI001F0E4F38|nr:TnsA-like heteromeric transposase endonuclease subunit [Streptomyces sp. A1499]